MKGAFRIVLVLTLLCFTYTSSISLAGKEVVDKLRWVWLGLLCLYAMWPLKALPGSFSGARVKAAGFAFAAFALLSSTWSYQKPYYTFGRALSLFFLAVFIFKALWPRLRFLRDYTALMNVLYTLAWVTVVISMLLFAVMRDATVRPFTHAFQGLFGNPNTLGMVYAVLFPVMVARFYYRKGLLPAALAVAMFAFLLLSKSRAGLLGAFFGTATFYACYYGKKVWIAAVLVLLLLIPYTVFQEQATVLDQAEQDFMRGEHSLNQFGSGRFGMWMAAFERFKQRPFTGYGFGTGGDLYLESGEPFRYHSSFTQIAVELGILGLVFFFVPMGYTGFRTAQFHLVHVGNPRVRAVIGGLMGGWLGGALDSFFESWLFSVGNIATVLAWICFAGGVKAMSEAELLDGESKDAGSK